MKINFSISYQKFIEQYFEKKPLLMKGLFLIKIYSLGKRLMKYCQDVI